MRRGRGERLPKRRAGAVAAEVEDAPRRGVDRLHQAGAIDDDQARREAFDDLVGQPLRRFGARRRGALLLLQLGQRILQRHRQHRALAAVLGGRLAAALRPLATLTTRISTMISRMTVNSATPSSA